VRDLAESGRAAMVVGPHAYDFTDFLKNHPGGPDYLKRNAGKVATAEFVASHPLDVIERTLQRDELARMRLGLVDESTIKPEDIADPASSSHSSSSSTSITTSSKPSLESCINVYDFEAIANGVISEQAWAYYSSGGDDEITLRENHSAFHRLWLKPRVMVNVKNIDMRTTILGHPSSFPVFLSAVAMCKLGHPEGETAWNKACEAEGCIYMIPTLSGCAFSDIVGSVTKGKQPMFFQLYVNQDRAKTKEIVERAEANGCTAMFITCDAPQLGNREKDRRVKVSHSGAAVQSGSSVKKSEGTSKALTTFIDPSLNWDDLPWFRSITKMKIILKGIGSAEDAVLAMEKGMDGVVLSNHGGRQLDFARSGIEVLPDAMAALNKHKSYDPAKFEVFVDGGVRRGTDIFKALALGAKAVGIGRPALYAMSAFGTDGVIKMLQILKSELEMTMRLMGTPTLAHIRPEMVIADQLKMHISGVPQDFLQQETYIPAVTQAYRNRFGRANALAATSTSSSSDDSHSKEPSTASTSSTTPGYLAATSSLVSSTLWGILVQPFFLSSDPRTLVHRSSLLLLVYLVVHAGGNLIYLLGPEMFNAYSALLRGPLGLLVRGIEVYLLLAFIVHASSAAFLTNKYGNLHPGSGSAVDWWKRARLMLSGSVVSGFLYFHLQHFRLGAGFKDFFKVPSASIDLFKEVTDVLRDPLVASLYGAAVLVIGAHSYWGVEKAVVKFGIADPSSKPLSSKVRAIGQGLVIATTAAFVIVTAKAYLNGLSK
jgi:L-lactate dehydrogenase (cytochrome)